jgi:cellulose synthase (UDP-forming)
VTIPSALLASLALLLGLALLLPCLPTTSVAARLGAAGLVAVLNLRYVAWRCADTLPRLALSFDALWAWSFFLFELLAVLCATWHILLLVRPSDRTAEADEGEAALRRDPQPPDVDVFIATYNEPRHVLERTLDAAQALDYPRFKVWVLDDGCRPWLQALAEERGVEYLARADRRGFKAGNLNHGLRHASAEVVLCLDADFAVVPHFLRRTVGLLADPEVAIVQTPQCFANSDAVQANLRGSDAWPEEQRVFFDVMQPARDTFDNAFCHGTSFVVKRRCLDEIGGFPEATICEDLYSTYVLKEKGYLTRYLNEPLSAGLAADNLAEFVKQRCRWAQGTLQCLWLPKGPLRARRLSVLDRLFLLDPILFYVSYLYIALTLVAPAVYWWTGTTIFHSKLGHLLNMFAPRMGASMVVLYWLSGRRVVPIVSELGRAVGIFHVSRAVLQGLLRPFSATFQVTLKGERRDQPRVQWPLLRPFLLLAGLTIGGMALNVTGVHQPTSWSEDLGMNVALTSFVLWSLFLCCLACVDRPLRGLTTEPGVTHGSALRSVLAIASRVLAR